MAYLHCHACGWKQDDFWSLYYNPARAMLALEERLLNNDLDKQIELPDGWHTIERKAIFEAGYQILERINEMFYRTEAEYRAKNPTGCCPLCGMPGLDID